MDSQEKLNLFPQGQLGRELSENLHRGNSFTIDGVSGGGFALLASLFATLCDRNCVIVVAKTGQVERFAADMAFFTEKSITGYPTLAERLFQEDTAVFRRDDLDFGARLRVLRELGAKKNSTIVTSIAALLQGVPTPQEVAANTLFLASGDERSPESIIHRLVEARFQSVSVVELPGEFSQRGNLLDIFAADWEGPVRLEFFGDEIDSIRRFDVATQCSSEPIRELELILLRRDRKPTGSFADYLSKDSVIYLCEKDQILQEIGNLYRLDDDDLLPNAGAITPLLEGELYQTVSAATYCLPTPSSPGESPQPVIATSMESVDRFSGSLQTTFNNEQLVSQTDREQIILVCPTEAERHRLTEMLSPTLFCQKKQLRFVVGDLSGGFDWSAESLLVLVANELLGRLQLHRPVRRRLGKVIDSFAELLPGDLVIHVGYGLARFRGLKTIKKTQIEEEHLELEFADRVTLYVPASRISLIQKYVGAGKGAPKLAKINGTTWAKKKQTVTGAIFHLAMEMLDMQAARNVLCGNLFAPDSDWQRDFEGSFPWQETNDQLTAIEAIKNDLERPIPMDRLLCGDVGFGKTEVAIRAAFKAVDSGFQVAVLVPTTVLAEQHFRVFKERMATFPITIEALSRFTPTRKQREIKERLKKGELDIVIGTHGLTRGEIEFANLGLVVVDEEQKFGVADKEQLKRMRQLVDVLSMSATPIPRTLHFSLLGLRDISNLETPPDNRLPVETQVVRFDDTLIRKVILREIQRQGQIYFVHNRVKDIEEVAWKLKRIVPEVRLAIGHAQMPDDQLEEIMRDFVLHKYDMLLCTTIIESGLDIPNANTIFINEAHRFGLAELHQLRGRVGRDRYQAYCYLLLDPNAFLAPQSKRRLQAIQEHSHLGAGFHIAMRDLEIRGAGNILGTEQSGHIAIVGYEMYCDLLEGAVRTLKKLPQKTIIEVEIDLPGTALIPQSYIADQRSKIDIYRRLLRIINLEQCDDIQAELRDRFGPFPAEVARLLLYARIRVLAWDFRIYSVTIRQEFGVRYLTFGFHHAHLMETCRAAFERKGLPLRLTSDQKGHLALPPELLLEGGEVDTEKVTPFIYHLFSKLERPCESPMN